MSRLNIEELRREIDETDEKITALFLKRLELSRKIGEIKKENGIPVYDPEREKNILSRLTESAGDSGVFIKELYGTVLI